MVILDHKFAKAKRKRMEKRKRLLTDGLLFTITVLFIFTFSVLHFAFSGNNTTFRSKHYQAGGIAYSNLFNQPLSDTFNRSWT